MQREAAALVELQLDGLAVGAVCQSNVLEVRCIRCHRLHSGRISTNQQCLLATVLVVALLRGLQELDQSIAVEQRTERGHHVAHLLRLMQIELVDVGLRYDDRTVASRSLTIHYRESHLVRSKE